MRIIQFYTGVGTDDSGRYISQLWEFSNSELERRHDYIQWLFPLPEASMVHRDAPLLTEDERKWFTTDPGLMNRVRRAVMMMRNFFEETSEWKRTRDHNHLRITRIIRFLTLIGMKDEAREFYLWCNGHAPSAVQSETRWYWEEALNERPAWLR